MVSTMPRVSSSPPEPIQPDSEHVAQGNLQANVAAEEQLERVSTTWCPEFLPAPKAKPAASPPAPKQLDQPDRHFEAMVTFDTGFANQTTEGVHMIQNVAAMVA